MTNSPGTKAFEYLVRIPDIEPEYPRSALLVIDLQYGFASREHGGFKRLRESNIGDSGEYAISRIEELVVPTVARLTSAFRNAALPVIYARCATQQGDGSDVTARHRAKGIVYPVNSKEAQILDEISPQETDIVLTKTGSGCFASTNLDHLLRNMGVSTLVVTGMWTNSCVETTVRTAADLDYRTVIVEESCVAMTPERHEYTLSFLNNNFCTVKSVEEVVESVETGIERDVSTATPPGRSSEVAPSEAGQVNS